MPYSAGRHLTLACARAGERLWKIQCTSPPASSRQAQRLLHCGGPRCREPARHHRYASHRAKRRQSRAGFARKRANRFPCFSVCFPVCFPLRNLRAPVSEHRSVLSPPCTRYAPAIRSPRDQTARATDLRACRFLCACALLLCLAVSLCKPAACFALLSVCADTMPGMRLQ